MKVSKLRLWHLSVLYAVLLLISTLVWNWVRAIDRSDENSLNSNVKKTESITFWNLFGGGDGTYADEITKNFNHLQKKYNVASIRLSWEEYYSKVAAALLAGKGPDVAVCHIDRLSPFVKAGLISDIDAIKDNVKVNYNDFLKNNSKSVTFGGKHYAIPIDTHFIVMYYNVKLLKRAGLLNKDNTLKERNITRSGFEEMLRRIKRSNPGILPFSMNVPYINEAFYNLYYEADGEIVGSDGKIAFDRQKAINVIKFILELSDMGLTDLSDTTKSYGFENGKAAIWWGGVWEASKHLADKVNVKACMPLPPLFGSYTHAANSHTLIIPAYVSQERKRAALEFAKYYAFEGEKLWAKAGHVPSVRKIVDSTKYKEMPFRKYFLESLKTIKFSPKIDKWNAIDITIKEELQAMVQRKVSPEFGVDSIIERIKKYLCE